MLEREQIEQFLNKKIIFSWTNEDKQTFSKGVLKSVTDKSIAIIFNDKTQLFSLESLITMREEDVSIHP